MDRGIVNAFDLKRFKMKTQQTRWSVDLRERFESAAHSLYLSRKVKLSEEQSSTTE